MLLALKKDANVQVAKYFEQWLYTAGTLKIYGIYGAGARYRGEVMSELDGKNLACWCKEDEDCHGDSLLTLANA